MPRMSCVMFMFCAVEYAIQDMILGDILNFGLLNFVVVMLMHTRIKIKNTINLILQEYYGLG